MKNDSSIVSSACCGTRDWMKSVALDGSMPQASQSTNMSHTVCLDDRGILVVRGERVPVGGEEEARVLVLQLHPVLERAVVVAEVHRARGAHSGKYAVLEHRC